VSNHIYTDFLEGQGQSLSEFCDGSSRLECKLIQTEDSMPPNIFMVKLRCAHMVMEDDQVQRSEEPSLIAIQLPGDYLRRTYQHPGQILSLVVPRNCWHPNLSWPHICAGNIAPGTPVVELVLRCYEIFTYNKFTPEENDCLNPLACRWARQHMQQFPLESEPLRDAHLDTAATSSDARDFVVEPVRDTVDLR